MYQVAVKYDNYISTILSEISSKSSESMKPLSGVSKLQLAPTAENGGGQINRIYEKNIIILLVLVNYARINSKAFKKRVGKY
jgi:hypothetical protein